MGRSSREKRRRKKAKGGGAARRERARKLAAPAKGRAWSREKWPVLKIVGLCLGFLVILEFLFVRFGSGALLESYKSFGASICALILRVLGEEIQRHGPLLVGRIPLTVANECLAIQPTLVYTAVVLSFPTAIPKRLWGVALGVAFIQGMNIVRVVSLYYVGVWFPGSFDFVHLELWQFGFILLAFLSWLVWARWAVREPGELKAAQPPAATPRPSTESPDA